MAYDPEPLAADAGHGLRPRAVTIIAFPAMIVTRYSGMLSQGENWLGAEAGQFSRENISLFLQTKELPSEAALYLF
ncbi:hypothetical protein A8F94_17560 [Bacillus sp. FJAT-27225]|nr:hypothetical protein A8F94_17560 [Bacillus sp. FJAT-27225]